MNHHQVRSLRLQLGLSLNQVGLGIDRSGVWVGTVERGEAGSPQDIEWIAAFLRAYEARVKMLPAQNIGPRRKHAARA